MCEETVEALKDQLQYMWEWVFILDPDLQDLEYVQVNIGIGEFESKKYQLVFGPFSVCQNKICQNGKMWKSENTRIVKCHNVNWWREKIIRIWKCQNCQNFLRQIFWGSSLKSVRIANSQNIFWHFWGHLYWNC